MNFLRWRFGRLTGLIDKPLLAFNVRWFVPQSSTYRFLPVLNSTCRVFVGLLTGPCLVLDGRAAAPHDLCDKPALVRLSD